MSRKKCKKNAIKLMLFKPLTLSTTLVLVLISKMGRVGWDAMIGLN